MPASESRLVVWAKYDEWMTLRAWAEQHGWTLEDHGFWRHRDRPGSGWSGSLAVDRWREQKHAVETGQTCAKCGFLERERQYTDVEEQKEFPLFCFGCRFWAVHARNAGNPQSVRVNGYHHWIEPDLSPDKDS